MNKILRFILIACLVACAVVVSADKASADLQSNRIAGGFKITDDSSNTTLFELRKAGDVGTDRDTSDVYEAKNWNHIVLQVKGTPKLDELTVRAVATALDSGASIVYTQGSNDRVYWKDIDTTTAADSLMVAEELWFKERSYRYLRWIVVTTTKSDDSGVTVELNVNTVNNR